MEDCHISYNSIVCMLELPMPAQGLDRRMTIFTRGFHVYGSHCNPHNNSYAGLPLPPTSTHIYIWNRWDTLKLTVSCPRTRCNAPTLKTKTELLNVEYSAQPFSHHDSYSDPYDWSGVDRVNWEGWNPYNIA